MVLLGTQFFGKAHALAGFGIWGSRTEIIASRPKTEVEPTPAVQSTPTANFVREQDVPKQPAPAPAEIKQVQTRLLELGFLNGSADGIWGSRSRTALQAFKAANGVVSSSVQFLNPRRSLVK